MPKWLKWIAIILLAIALPFGLLLMLIPLAVSRTVAKVDPNWHPDASVIAWTYLWCKLYAVPFKFALSLLYNEGASEPRALNVSELAAIGHPAEDLQGYPVGDIGDSRGPALGPGQVLRVNVERQWTNAPWYLSSFVVGKDPSDLAIIGNEHRATWVSVRMMREALDQADGDLWDAAKRYNGGGGSDPRAIAYADKSQNTLERIA